MSWCASCGVPVSEGSVVCDECVPKEALSQSVNITMIKPPNVILDSQGDVVDNIPGYGMSTTKAFDMSAGSKSRSPLNVVQKIKWSMDRQQWERGVWLYDKNNDLYSETWFSMESGEITYGPKQEKLSEHRNKKLGQE